MRIRLALFLLTILGILLIASQKVSLLSISTTSVNPEILVDQFGYRPQDEKIAVIKFKEDKNSNFISSNEVFDVKDIDLGETAYSGKLNLWNQGKVHPQSEDVVGWFNFSDVIRPGKYIIQSKKGEQSFPFEISENVYQKVLIAAVRMYFYQRGGYAKKPPYAESKWQDEAAFLGSHQDTEARYVNDKSNDGLIRDVHGGWFDAGDTNEYVTFASGPVHQLLLSYSQNPSIWTDDFNIPESGNRIPDLLDEVKFELDWLKRMQDEDGGAFIKLGTLDYSFFERPSLDIRPRFYGPKCSSSTIAIAGMFAHAAFVFQGFSGLEEYANDLRLRSEEAWKWFLNNSIETNCDTQEIKSGDADVAADGQIGDAVVAAIYLFALTGESQYTNYIQENLGRTNPFGDDVWSRYWPSHGDALLFYAHLPNSDLALRKRILERAQLLIHTNTNAYGKGEELDPYRAYMPDEQYHWGSNSVKANYGNSNYDVAFYKLTSNDLKAYESRALDSLHYLHGVNPLGIVYLTNMYVYGAEFSANEMWHEWFGHSIYSNALKSSNGPAPAYLTGGPNKNYTGSASLAHQPPMKAYLDSNRSDLRMWEITEPSTGYQSAYIKLLSKFVGN